ncbi:MAG: efflux RND transporter periplasmic adaptor subunit [Alphaproteobacteria bacterium]|nr:efflux RND transporter periplasmic adaptor subunit [Alphaproteobacteria bacterium]
MRRWLVVLIAIAVAVAAILILAPRPLATWGSLLIGRGGPDGVLLYGNVDIRQVDLAFDAEGRIAELKVEEGDPVAPGQVLAVLDPEFYAQAVRLAEARRDAQKAVLDKLEAGSRPEEIERARADVAALSATQENAEAVFRRRQALVTTGTVAQQAFEDARAALDESAGRLKAARETLALAVAGPRREEIEQARAQLRAEEATLDLARNRHKHTTLTAPSQGIVLTRVHEPGAVVLPNSTIYTVALTDKVWIRTYVPETLLGAVKPGMPVEVLTDSRPGQAYQGWVGYISPTAEFTPKTVETPELRTQLVYRLRVHVTTPDAALRQGMPVTIRLAAAP